MESARDGRRRMDVERDGDGSVTALRSGGESAFFERDGLGRIVETRHADGSAGRYFHDALGNRELAQYGDGGRVRYGHDPAGNIVRVEVTEADGATRVQTTVVGDMNRVERIVYEGSATVEVQYDGMGRPVRFASGADTVSARYDDAGRLARLESEKTGAVWRPPAAAQAGSTAAAPRRDALASDPLGAAQPDYGVVGFDEATFAAAGRDPVALAVPGLADARTLVAAAAPLFERGAAAAFEKPSNPVFQAREYRSTNCCVPCSAAVCLPCGFGTGNLPGLPGRPGTTALFGCYCSPALYWDIPTPIVGPSDEIGRIIAEYRGLKKVPTRAQFVKEHSSEHFSKEELNSGDYDYFIPGKMTEIAEAVRKAYNDAIDSDPNTDYGIRITSGYRNPRKNDRVGGRENSRHQWGDAVDLAPPWNPNARPPGKSYSQAVEDIRVAAEAVYGENTDYDILKNDAKGYVHVEYDPKKGKKSR